MAVSLKKLNEQIMVITGASSGIGLVTARMAAKRGARLVLSARSEEELRELTEEIKANGGQAIAVASRCRRCGRCPAAGASSSGTVRRVRHLG